MSVTYFFARNIPDYQCLSTDVSGSKVSGISTIGSHVFFTDTGTEWIVGDDLKLVRYAQNTVGGASGSSSTLSGSTVNVANFPASQPISGSISVLAGESYVGQVGETLVRKELEITNLSGSASYSGSDVVSGGSSITTPYEMSNCFRVNGGSGYIFGINLTTNNPLITPVFRVHFYNSASAVIATDNNVFIDYYNNKSYYLNYYDLPAMTTSGSTSGSCSMAIDVSSIRLPIVAEAGSKSLYVALQTLSGYTSIANQKYNLVLMINQN
jgi:hypothetical protein